MTEPSKESGKREVADLDSQQTLPLLPLTSGAVLPGMVVTMALETEEAVVAADAAGSAGGKLVLVPHLEGTYASVGVIAEIVEKGQFPGGSPALAVKGLARAAIGATVPGTGRSLWVQVDPCPVGPVSETAVQLAREYRAVLENILLTRGARRMAEMLREVTEPSQIADLAGYSPDLTLNQKVKVLEAVDVEERLRLVLGWARETLADLTLREQIKSDVEEGMEKTQREFLLRRQLDAIRKELAQLDGTPEEGGTDDYRSRIEVRDLPDAVRAAVMREVAKLERTSEQSAEQGWIRTWLDTLLEIPWEVVTEDNLDVDAAARVLDHDHEGLVEVKERILEQLAVRKLRAERSTGEPADSAGHPSGHPGVTGPPSGHPGPAGSLGGPAPRGFAGAIVVLVGPPGVGKTSLGESIARALGRKFVRVALGGVRDEAEIRGHRRTYVGAQPGRLARALREAGTMNPVVVLDEVDKIGTDFRGDPSSALLEVLDPAQNHTFRDHYLEVELDLSQVLFVATANVVETIPSALLDRMEVIRIDGYTEDEKLSIARKHLLPRQIERAALREGEIELSDDALRAVSADYTREAGVRSLERELGKLCRKVATAIASGSQRAPVTVESGDLRAWLGRPRFFFEAADRTAVPGVATGLAVTGSGGDVLFVEATVMDAAEGLTLTGQLGEVMKESGEIALSYVRSHAGELGIDPGVFSGKRFHLHVPAGAVPKDGPSAGVTMVTALVSLLSGRPVRPVVGMTGEVTLQGRVLPIGGVKQKVLAAHRAGLTEVLLPARNGLDLEDVPESVQEEMTFHLVDSVADVLVYALGTGEIADTESARLLLTGGARDCADGRSRGRSGLAAQQPGAGDIVLRSVGQNDQ